jgi:hypothetical protein
MQGYLHGFLSTLIFVILFTACSDEEVQLKNSLYNEGVYIINEGNFSDSDGSLSYFDPDSLKVVNNIFEKINNRPFAGLFQSMFFYNERGYMIDQTGRAEIVNGNDLTSVGILSTHLEIPRYFAGFQDTGFISDWGPYDENFVNKESGIKVYNLTTLTFELEIETASRPEDLILLKNKLYVANSATNLVSVYDPTDYSLINEIEISLGPTRFVSDKMKNLWTICTGAYVSNGALVGIETDNDQILFNLELADYPPNGRISINGEGDIIYFMSEEWNPDFTTKNTVYRVELIFDGLESLQVEIPAEVVSGNNWYGMGIDPGSDILYVADAAGFQGNGSIYRYNLQGDLIDKFFVGRAPRDFVFRNN